MTSCPQHWSARWFETELLTREENLVGLMAVNRDLIGQAETFDRADRVVLDMDSSESPVHGQRGTAEHWIKEGKQAAHWTRLSYHRFRANEVRLQLSVLAHNLGQNWSRPGRATAR